MAKLEEVITSKTVQYVEKKKEKKSRTTNFQKVVYGGKEYAGWVVRINGVITHEYVIDPSWLPTSADEICPEYMKAYCKNKGLVGLKKYEEWLTPQYLPVYEVGHKGEEDYIIGHHYFTMSQTQIKKEFIKMLIEDHPDLKDKLTKKKTVKKQTNLEWVREELKAFEGKTEEKKSANK